MDSFNQVAVVAAVFLIPLIPSLLIYWLLPPGRTQVTGPFRGLTLNLQGAFAAYFIVLLVCVGLFLKITESSQTQMIKELNSQIGQLRSQIKLLREDKQSAQTWTVEGSFVSGYPDETKVFVNDDVKYSPGGNSGSFRMNLHRPLENGKATPPFALYVMNPFDGMITLDLNQDGERRDINKYNIQFNDTLHKITIKKPVDFIERHSQ